MLSDSDKEDAWTLLLEWLEHHDIVELLDALSDADWCRGQGQYVRGDIRQSLPLWERSAALLLNSREQTFQGVVLSSANTFLILP